MSTQLAPEWEQWVVDNALDGVPTEELIAGLVDEGVSEEQARTEIARLLEGPAFGAADRFARRARRRDKVLSVLSTLDRGHGGGIERRSAVDVDTFYLRYVREGRPVVLTDVASAWRAIGRWGPESLTETLGEEEVRVCIGRNALEHPDRHYEACTVTMTMAEYARRVADAGETNDLYLIANNRVSELPAFAALLDEVTPLPPYLVGSPACSFWFGPAGTHTPLHHDGCHILFCQITGRKRFWLVPPWSAELIDTADGFYSTSSIADAVAAGARGYEVVLEPGEALFLPGYWWHEVRALEMSVSLSFLNFRAPTTFEGYRLDGRL